MPLSLPKVSMNKDKYDTNSPREVFHHTFVQEILTDE